MKLTSFFKSRALRALSLAVPAFVVTGIAMSVGGPERRPEARTVAPDTDTDARVIVKFRADAALMKPLAAGALVRPQHAGALSKRLGLTLSDGRPIGDRAQVVRGQGLESQALANRLATQPDVEYAVVDQRMHWMAVPNDPLYPAGQAGAGPAVGQWYLRPPASSAIVDAMTITSSINAEGAWNITTGSPSVVVAVLDTGVRRDHPDLTSKLLSGYDFVSDTALSVDGDGRDADPSDPGDSTGTNVPSSWHGTETAGLIGAATNNGIGMASVGRDVMLLPVRVLGKGGGHESDVEAAMLWAAGLSSTPIANPNPARIINLSLGSAGSCSQAYSDTVRQVNAANVVVVAAAGNDGLAVGMPANCPGVIAVAGLRHLGTKVGYSDLGPEITVAAPAGNCFNATLPCLFPLLTTSNSGVYTPVSNAAGGSIYTGGGTNASLGTSFSAPLVSGSVGLMLSINPALTAPQIRKALQVSARPFPSSGAPPSAHDNGTVYPVAACSAPSATAQNFECYCTTTTCGAGMLDTSAAVSAVSVAQSNITAPSAVITASATLDGTLSWPGSAASIAAYQWSLSSGSTLATLSGATNQSTVTLQPTGAGSGSVVVTLAVTDSVGRQSSSNVTVAVATVPASATTSSGGGGALGAGWLGGCLAAIAAVWAATPRRSVWNRK